TPSRWRCAICSIRRWDWSTCAESPATRSNCQEANASSLLNRLDRDIFRQHLVTLTVKRPSQSFLCCLSHATRRQRAQQIHRRLREFDFSHQVSFGSANDVAED